MEEDAKAQLALDRAKAAKESAEEIDKKEKAAREKREALKEAARKHDEDSLRSHTSNKYVKEANAVWKEVDADGNGWLVKSELEEFLQTHKEAFAAIADRPDMEATDRAIDAIFRKMDETTDTNLYQYKVSEDGKKLRQVSQDAFVQFYVDLKMNTADKATLEAPISVYIKSEADEIFDSVAGVEASKMGLKLSKSQIKKFLKEDKKLKEKFLGAVKKEGEDHASWSDLFEVMDKDEDGDIDKEEWADFYKNFLKNGGNKGAEAVMALLSEK